MKISIDQNKVTLAFKSRLPFIDDELQSKLDENEFAIPANNHMVLRISQDGREGVVKRWERDGSEVYYDPSRGFLSAEGSDIEKTSESFKRIHKIAKELCDSFESDLKWAELNFHCRCIGSKQPLIAIKEKLSTDIHSSLSDILDVEVKPFSIEFYSADVDKLDQALNEVVDWYHVAVRPLVVNPRYYLVTIVFTHIPHPLLKKILIFKHA